MLGELTPGLLSISTSPVWLAAHSAEDAMKIPSNALPQLQLTPTEEREILDKTDLMVHNALLLEREFHRQGGRIDGKEWKEITSVDNFYVYRQRRSAQGSSERRRASMSYSSTCTSTEEEDMAATSRNYSPVMCAGFLEGTLDDFLFGSFDGDERSWKLRAAYMKDKFADSRIFSKIVRPTPQDPYRFVGVKWFAIEVPAIIDSFLYMRDTFVMESTGMAKDEDGVPYAYFLFHDYNHPQLPELTEFGIIRNRVSICFIARQIAPDRIYIHARGYVNVGGDVIRTVGLAVAGVSLASTANSIEASYGKKLSWLIAKTRDQRRLAQTQARLHSHACRSCQKGIGKLLSRSSVCHVCGFSFCSKCTVNRKIVIDVSSIELTSKALSFCYGCVIQAKVYPAREIALDTIVPSTMSRRDTASTLSRRDMGSRRDTVARTKSFDSWSPGKSLGAY
ncbi:hypothetical protein Poli38472_012564 [Pythium oligandrum]|uniref:FYVE-type domain-containing protein n=1 Tax=Pythium oligandrum TaxID=41045 RepID=A0A8K1CF26_PYTOL|nr:hypothetical protein Poli38472_012564 [Pythium oligandrum]|eukprot:TMW61373.1 hypothetical protein Poli38472_012564 [Pythium oligandrum]